MEKKRKKIIIVGAGFGGLALAKKLKNSVYDVVIIDKNNFHAFQPLLYQVATGGLEPYSIAYPIRRIFRGYKNVRFRLAEVISINQNSSCLETSIGRMSYDYLVIATGSTSNFFNFKPIENKLFTLKSITDALDLRSFIMQNMEKALTLLKNQNIEETINVIIVGGGATGIELAGALAEMKKHVLPKDFPEINFNKMNIYLFEAGPKLLANMSQNSSSKAKVYLEDLGVEVFLDSKVTHYDGQLLETDDGKNYQSHTVIWTAGVKGNPIGGIEAEFMAAGDRIKVDAYNKIVGYENIYSIGDVASMDTQERGHPMLAQVAIQQGKNLAHNFLNLNENLPLKKFDYNDKGIMATIGRNKAVADLANTNFQGKFAWFIWMFVHLLFLVGFRNKMVTLIDWIQNYFSFDRPLGLIIRKHEKVN